MDVSVWLDTLGLGQYAQVFTDNDIDSETLVDLNNDDLKELGVASLGHRKRLFAAVAALTGHDQASTEATAPDNAAGVSPPNSTEAERRQLTVMFCDLVGSTELSRRLDPEDLREVMRRYQDAVAGAVTQYGGHVAKYLGDGVLAYFGWPQAYEDQAERALHAGLGAVAAVDAVKNDDDTALAARVGVATGQVVVGDLVGESGRDAQAVSGETPNLAARLQQLAAPGEVVVDDVTRRLVGQTFVLKDLGGHELKGFDEAVQAWGISGEVVAESRFDAAHGATLTRLVGRESELALLLDRWQLAQAGEGQAVFISGEAGIGKSRLMEGLRDQVAQRQHIIIRNQCSPYHGNSALYPTIRQLERSAGFAPGDGGEDKLDKLEALLAQVGDGDTGDGVGPDARLFAHLLSLPYEQRYSALEQPPQQTKERLLEALIAQLLRLTQSDPVLFLFEDAHWIDPTSQELLELTIGRLHEARVLLIVTHRPEWQPPQTGHNHVTSLQLNRLGKSQGAEIARAIVGDDVSGDVVERIVSRTDGIPLFIEELAKSFVERGLDIAEADIPATLQASLLARIDRLDPVAKEIAQIGAVIGREFSHDLLAAIVGKAKAELDGGLTQLVQSELVFRTGTSVAVQYYFKHALVQDAVHDSMLRGKRRNLHAKIARFLEERFSHIAANQPEFVAHHLSASGQSAKSVDFWIAAAEQALSRAAYQEANSFVERGQTAVQAQSKSHETMATAVDLLFLKYAAHYPLGDPQSLLAILAEAENIMAGLNDPVRLCKVLSTQTYVLASDGQVDTAIEVGQRNVESIAENGDVNIYCHGKLMLGRALYAAGRYKEAIQHITGAMERVGEDVEHGRDLHGLSHTISTRGFLLLCEAERGEFAQGARLISDGLRLLHHMQGGMHERLWMEYAIGRLYVVKGDFTAAIAALEPVWPHCESNYPVYIPRVASSLGMAYAASGNIDKGLELLCQADDQSSSSGFQFGHALVLSQLAEVLLMAGNEAEARDKATHAIEIARGAGELGNEGWAASVLGDVFAAVGIPESALSNYNRALAIAEKLEMGPLQARCSKGLNRVAA